MCHLFDWSKTTKSWTIIMRISEREGRASEAQDRCKCALNSWYYNINRLYDQTQGSSLRTLSETCAAPLLDTHQLCEKKFFCLMTHNEEPAV